MKCSCGKTMLKGLDGDKQVMICLPCGKTKPLVSHSDTEKQPRGTNTRVKLQKATEGQESGNDAGSDAEESFLSKWVDLHPDLEAVREYKPCLHREWRLDFSWPDSMVAVEVEGYGHQRDNRYKTDIDKYNWLAYSGWILFRCTKAMIQSDDDRFFRMVAAAVLSKEKNER